MLTTPWSVEFPWELHPDYGFYEFACHEGNTAVRNYIETSRFERANPPPPALPAAVVAVAAAVPEPVHLLVAAVAAVVALPLPTAISSFQIPLPAYKGGESSCPPSRRFSPGSKTQNAF